MDRSSGRSRTSEPEMMPGRTGTRKRLYLRIPKTFVAVVQANLIASAVLVPVAAAPSGNPAANLDQCGNGSTGTEPCLNTGGFSNWVNGNLGASKSQYKEGDSIPYRLIFTNLAV